MKRIILILTITVLVIVGAYKLYSFHLVMEFKQYCIEDCEVTHVSKSELDSVKQSRSEIATTNILDYKEHISDTEQRLSNYDLNDKLSSKLDSTKVSTEYNSDLDYSVDELIDLEANYKHVSDELDQIELEFNQSTYRTQIAGYQDIIKQDKERLELADLSSEEQQQVDNLDNQLKEVDYDRATGYDLDQLNTYAKEYKELAKQYDYLAKYN